MSEVINELYNGAGYQTTPEGHVLLGLKEVEVNKLALEEDDVLIIKVKSADRLSPEAMAHLQEQFQTMFPNNAVMLFGLKPDNDLAFEVVRDYTSRSKRLAPPEEHNCASPTSYCDDCHCGKKEQIESERE